MVDLEPWVVIVGNPADAHIAMWRVAGREDASLAIFSSATLAHEYAIAFCQQPFEVRQLTRHALVQLLVMCFQQGTQYAALDPDGFRARQMFVLRDVLAAARAALKSSKAPD